MALEFLEELSRRRRFGMKPGLDTIRALMARLGDPQKTLRAIHVAGTNGKGAVCAMLDACLRAGNQGLVGRYTSPHLVRLNERFFLAGKPVVDEVLESAAREVLAVLEGVGEGPLAETTFFEALTATAFVLYSRAHADWTVLECGLGGRLDATNICSPALTVITRIGLDHCDWLGNTLEAIAREKAGIVKPGVPVVLGRNEPRVCEVVSARARELGAPYHYAPDLAAEGELPADFALAGSFNRENAVTALAALKVLFGRDLGAQLLSGFSQVVWPGRFQRIGHVIVDGAHNPPAARALAEALSETVAPHSLELVAGFCGDKDAEGVLRILAPFILRGHAVRTNNPRSLSAEETAAKIRAAGIPAVSHATLAEALSAAKGPTLVCGSLFLAGEALVALKALPWDLAPRETGADSSEALVATA